jgi:hypothetical protein
LGRFYQVVAIAMEKAIIVLVDLNKAAIRGDQHTSDAL